MLGRFGASFQYRDIKSRLESLRRLPRLFPALQHRSVARQDVPITVRKRLPQRTQADALRLGAVVGPSCAIGQRMINARAETLLEKPSSNNSSGRGEPGHYWPQSSVLFST
jgi:putative SOS response-associated peptidase YedK